MVGGRNLPYPLLQHAKYWCVLLKLNSNTNIDGSLDVLHCNIKRVVLGREGRKEGRKEHSVKKIPSWQRGGGEIDKF